MNTILDDRSNLTKPLASYPHSRRIGSTVYLAGQGCRNPETNECVGIVRDDNGKVTDHCITTQTKGVIANLERALKSEGLDLTNLVDVTVFLRNMNEFNKMNEVWNATFTWKSPPTRTTVAVVDLPHDNFVEMKAIAFSPEK